MNYTCFCKATDRGDNEPRYSPHWVTAKRAMFKIFDDRIECASWTIQKSDITFIHVYSATQWCIPCRILQITTADGNYQFGFNPWANPFKHLGIEYTESSIKLSYSPFSIAIRVVLWLGIGFMVWGNWFKS